ncbi:hypothetical protein AUP68_10649 [Ilyonectria robusta]
MAGLRVLILTSGGNLKLQEYGVDWWCTSTDSLCCGGDVTVSCMPAGSGCCTTGFYCLAGETCALADGYQYCIYEESGAEVTQTAEAAFVGQMKASDSSSGGSLSSKSFGSSSSESSSSSSSDNADSSASTARFGKL